MKEHPASTRPQRNGSSFRSRTITAVAISGRPTRRLRIVRRSQEHAASIVRGAGASKQFVDATGNAEDRRIAA